MSRGMRSSSAPRSKVDHSPTVGRATDAALSARRPSWTPETGPDDVPALLGPPSSALAKRRGSRQPDEGSLGGGTSPLAPEWAGAVAGLLKTRRASYVPSLPEGHTRARRPRVEPEASPEVAKTGGGAVGADGQPVSPEEGKSLRSSWEINVKDLVGDAVGNMSISPGSRDIVLAARRGLFIIDLESPFSIPRFLPQGGTWDVADVQWNPHPSRAEYIVSTSSEKLLIWNLLLGGKTSIQHILKSHYRAITDINWHTTECDVVISTGIDSWLWAWDLRTPEKPIFGLSAFNAGGTQVKWNRRDPNILASSHSNQVLIWDRRKGSLPITKITAHSSKIYGIDWSRSSRNELVTCSLDKSIKTWDINATFDTEAPEPKSCILTNYPVWRARNLPFGEGILSLPQRGDTTLEMYAKRDVPALVETFEGHSDVVKEFVWRKGPKDDFQLITWSKDRTLRFWPIDAEVTQKVGHVSEIPRGRSKVPRTEVGMHATFRNPPETEDKDASYFPALSAPVGSRNILAEVRAPRSSLLSATAAAQPHFVLPADKLTFVRTVAPTAASGGGGSGRAKAPSTSVSMVRSTGGTMSKGGTGVKSIVQVDQLAWLASVKVGSKRGSSSGRGSHGDLDSAAPSRLGSVSRPPSGPDRSLSEVDRNRHSSGSLGRALEEKSVKEGENNQSLHDEITSVLTKLTASNFKINLEKHDLPKRRTCTLGLHGPWGENSSVFMRVTFNFPRDYPQAAYPHGTPTVELDRNPLISMRTRASILKHLRRIREQKRPCLEPCLRFLLMSQDNQNEHHIMDSESSSDDDDQAGEKEREVTVSLLRNHKNLAEPKTSQGAFGPDGELIAFFRVPPRFVRNVLRETFDMERAEESDEPSPVIPEPPTPPPVEEPQTPAASAQPLLTSYFQSPALVSDAVRRLGLAATDRIMRPIDPAQPEAGLDILRAMTNLLTVPQHKARRDSESKHSHSAVVRKNYAMLQARRSMIFVTSTRNIAGADRKVVADYVFTADSLREVCKVNAEAAKRHGRYDHERVFETLKTLFRAPEKGQRKEGESSFASDALAEQVITLLYSDVAKEKDIQMLAMIAMLVLQTEHATVIPSASSANRKKEATPTPSIPHRQGGGAGNDYFSLSNSLALSNPVSPAWPRLTSPSTATHAPSVSSSNSSRGSWSSLFNTGSMRNFMSGMQDTFKDGLSTPGEQPNPNPDPMRAAEKEKLAMTRARAPDSPGIAARRGKRARKDSWMHPNAAAAAGALPVSRSWGEGLGAGELPKSALAASYGSSGAGQRQGSLRFVDQSSGVCGREKKAVVFEPPSYEETTQPLFDAMMIEQFKRNVYAYCELLFRWQMYTKRLELLKAVNRRDLVLYDNEKAEGHRIGLHRICIRSDCKTLLPEKAHICPQCNTFCSLPRCTICRLPVKGLSRTCLTCSHVTHISCSRSFEVTVPICPSGCGCFCTGTDGPFTRPSTTLGLTPPMGGAMLGEMM